MSSEPTGVPVACSLDGDSAKLRMTRWQRLAETAQQQVLRETDSVVVEYQPGPWARGELTELVELERECCPFLSWQLDDGEALTLRISPAPGAGDEVTDMLPDLVTTFTAGQ